MIIPYFDPGYQPRGPSASPLLFPDGRSHAHRFSHTGCLCPAQEKNNEKKTFILNLSLEVSAPGRQFLLLMDLWEKTSTMIDGCGRKGADLRVAREAEPPRGGQGPRTKWTPYELLSHPAAYFSLPVSAS